MKRILDANPNPHLNRNCKVTLEIVEQFGKSSFEAVSVPENHTARLGDDDDDAGGGGGGGGSDFDTRSMCSLILHPSESSSHEQTASALHTIMGLPTDGAIAISQVGLALAFTTETPEPNPDSGGHSIWRD